MGDMADEAFEEAQAEDPDAEAEAELDARSRQRADRLQTEDLSEEMQAEVDRQRRRWEQATGRTLEEVQEWTDGLEDPEGPW